jgi:hypothetical protein
MIRVLAFLVATGLVVAAYAVRTSGPESGTDPAVVAAATSTLRCDAELRVACRALSEAGHDVQVEPAGVTYDALRGAANAAGPDVWVTVAPWPAMVDDARSRAGLSPLFTTSEVPLAVSPLVLVLWEERGDVLEANCAGELDLACVTGAAGKRWDELGGPETWGAFKLGIQDPSTSSVGLAVLALATAEELGTAEFGTRSLTDGAYLDWLSALSGAIPDLAPAAGSALAAMLQVGPAAFDVAATTEAVALTARDGGAQRAAELRLVPAPATTVDAVLAVNGTAPTATTDEVAEVVAGALGAEGWLTPATADGTSAAAFDGPPGAALPGAGAQTALRNTFDETVRR